MISRFICKLIGILNALIFYFIFTLKILLNSKISN